MQAIGSEALVADGFSVDLGALERASAGVDGTLDEVATRQVSAITPGGASIGHERLASSLSTFLSRWAIGVDSLAKDGREIAARLTACAADYRRAEQSNVDAIRNAILFGVGSDPGEH